MNRKNEVSDNFIEISFQVGTATVHNLSSLDKIGKNFSSLSVLRITDQNSKNFLWIVNFRSLTLHSNDKAFDP